MSDEGRASAQRGQQANDGGHLVGEFGVGGGGLGPSGGPAWLTGGGGTGDRAPCSRHPGQQLFCQPVLGQRRWVHPSTGEAVRQGGEAAQSPVRHLWINGLHFKSIATESTRPLSFFPMIMESIYILLFQNIKVFIW